GMTHQDYLNRHRLLEQRLFESLLFFQIEAEGLENIRETQTIAVPKVYAYSNNPGESFLALEWIEGSKSSDTEIRLGENMARLHQHFNDQHGYDNRTYIGMIPLN